MEETKSMKMAAKDLLRALLMAALLVLPWKIASAADPAQTGPDEQVLQRLQTATYDVTAVDVDEQGVRVKYRQSALQDQTTLPYAWVDMMMIVTEELPDVGRITLEVTYLQEPYFEVSASGAQITAVMADQMDLAQFISALEFKENRPLQMVLSTALYQYGYPYAGHTLEGTELHCPLLVSQPK